MLGLLLAEACVLAVPLDVANNSSNIGCQQGWITACGACVCIRVWPLLSFEGILCRRLSIHGRCHRLTAYVRIHQEG